MQIPRQIRTSLMISADAVGISTLVLSFDHGARIALYHGVTDEQGEGIFNYRKKFIATETFRYQIQWMKRHFEIVPLMEIIDRTRSGKPLDGIIAITFDDGYANNYSAAFPILHAEQVPATFFVTTGFVGGMPLPVDVIEYALKESGTSITVPWNDGTRTFSLATRETAIAADLVIRAYMKTLNATDALQFRAAVIETTGRDLAAHLNDTPYRPLTAAQIREMHAAGMSFAAHTHTHPILSRLSPQEIDDEIRISTDNLRSIIDDPVSIFAYPNGRREDMTPEVIRVLKRYGYDAALTTITGTVHESADLFALPRFTLDGTNEAYRFRLALSGVTDRIARLTGAY